MAPERELARLLSGTRAHRERHAPRIATLARSVDGERLSAYAAVQRMGPLLATRFLESAPDVDAGWTRFWLRERAEFNARNALRHRAGRLIAEGALAAAGVRALAMKGATLAEQLYGDETMRDSTDLDVLVAREQIPTALSALGEAGYHERTDTGRPSTLHVALEHEEGVLPPIDLHWRVHWLEDAFSSDMLERSTIANGALRPEPSDQLVSLLLFFQRDGFLGLRLAADIAACWDQMELKPDGLLEDYPRRYPALERALQAAALVAESIVGLPGRQLLVLNGRVRRRTAVATRLTNWQLLSDRDQAATDVSLVDGLCTPQGAWLAYARRYLLCDRQRIAEIYEVPLDASGRVRLLQIFHPFKITARYLIALRGSGIGRRLLQMDADVQLARSGSILP